MPRTAFGCFCVLSVWPGLGWLGGGVILGFLCELIWFSLVVLVWVNLGFILGFLVRVNLGQV